MNDDFSTALVAELPRLRRMAWHWRVFDPEDLVQETCKRALAARSNGYFDDSGDMEHWLVTILSNLRIERAKSTERRKIREAQHADHVEAALPAQQHRVYLGEVLCVIEQMPQPGAKYLVPAAFGTERELAKASGMPIGIMRNHLSRARKALRKVA